jgi:hypothetical protein
MVKDLIWFYQNKKKKNFFFRFEIN